MCPYLYETAVSPHLAARMEGDPVEMERVLHRILTKYAADMIMLRRRVPAELSALSASTERNSCWRILSRRRDLSCLIVADAGLGTINAVVLTAEYMKAHQYSG